MYKNDHRISGIIDIGGAPLRFYKVLKEVIMNTKDFTHEVLL